MKDRWRFRDSKKKKKGLDRNKKNSRDKWNKRCWKQLSRRKECVRRQLSMNNNNSNKRMEAEDHLLAQAQVLPLRSQIERGEEA